MNPWILLLLPLLMACGVDLRGSWVPSEDGGACDAASCSSDPAGPHGSASSELAADGGRTDKNADAGPGAPFPGFLDDFARPDGPALGNEWITRGANLALLSGLASASSPGYPPDALALRSGPWPADLEVSATVRVTTAGEVNLLLRLAPASREAGRLTGYGVRLRSNQITIVNWTSTSVGNQGANELVSTAVTTSIAKRYRLSLSVKDRFLSTSITEIGGGPGRGVGILDLSVYPHDDSGDVGFAMREIGDSVDDFTVQAAH